jgi:hypothetical protein
MLYIPATRRYRPCSVLARQRRQERWQPVQLRQALKQPAPRQLLQAQQLERRRWLLLRWR